VATGVPAYLPGWMGAGLLIGPDDLDAGPLSIKFDGGL
jgi:hypothetical protein